MEKCLLISNVTLYDELCCVSAINVKTTLQAFAFIFIQHRYRRTDATNFSMFGLTPMLPMSIVQIDRTLCLLVTEYCNIVNEIAL